MHPIIGQGAWELLVNIISRDPERFQSCRGKSVIPRIAHQLTANESEQNGKCTNQKFQKAIYHFA
jgi:hypothetical protein